MANPNRILLCLIPETQFDIYFKQLIIGIYFLIIGVFLFMKPRLNSKLLFSLPIFIILYTIWCLIFTFFDYGYIPPIGYFPLDLIVAFVLVRLTINYIMMSIFKYRHLLVSNKILALSIFISLVLALFGFLLDYDNFRFLYN